MNKKLLLIAFTFSVNFLFAGTINKPSSSQHGYTQNKGQVIDQNNNLNPAVKYLFNQGGLNVQLRTNGFSYDNYTIERKPMPKTGSENAPHNDPSRPMEDVTYHYHRIDIEFIGANASPQLVAQQPSKEYVNYYTTGTPEEGVLNVRTYQKVTYINLYDGIDLEFAISNNLPKYNFIIHPGADASQIKWKYTGAFKTTLQDGKIILSVEQGNLEENIPSSFINETSQNINVNYVSLSDNTYGFSIPTYDKHTTLTIDPVPWATYFGGSGDENLNKIITDSIGNLIITGYSASSTNIATSGAFQTTYGGGTMDMILAKFTSSGALLWSTYYGGTLAEMGYGLVMDRNGNFLVSGQTSSTSGIATSGAYQTTYGGGAMDAMVLKFSSLGARIWASYYGGSGADYGYGAATDTAGNIFFTGYTGSTSGIASSGAYQTTNASTGGTSYDVFLVKMNSSGSSRIWGTYYGGGNDDYVQDLTSDSIGNIVITGYTGSTTGIATSGAYQTSFSSPGYSDAFLAKFSISGSLIWGTYYGGNYTDRPSVVVASGSTIIIIGYTTSTINIASSGAYQTSYGGGSMDAFIVKFNSSGTTRKWGTYFGGTGKETGFSVCTDIVGNVYATGYTESSSGIATTGVAQTTLNGTGDGYLCKFDTSGTRIWSTYFGGNAIDGGFAVVTDTVGHVFVAGYSTSSSGIATSGAYQTTFNGVYDGLIVAFTSAGGLPVQLTSFDAKLANNKDVLCTWQTASELNNDYFEIERSVDGSQFTEIGKVKGNGTSNVVNSYQSTDVSAPLDMTGTLYYRLKQVDFDGKSTLSDVRVVNLNQLNNDLNIYPNPATNELHIETTANEKFDVQLFDITGKKVMENILFTNSTNINTSSLYQGMYFVRITDANGAVIKTQKVAVVR